MNKTVYLKEQDVPIWERARELSGDCISPVIMECLNAYVRTTDAERGWMRDLTFYAIQEDGKPKKQGFKGYWVNIENELMASPDLSEGYCVARTAKGAWAVIRGKLSNSEPEGVPRGATWGKLEVFGSLESFTEDLSHLRDRLRRWMMSRVEILDI